MTHNTQNINLTAPEEAFLWNTFIMDTKFRGLCEFSIKNIKDPDILPIFNYAHDIENQHISEITQMFQAINHPLPHGFTKEDINENADKLFSDIYMLEFLKIYAGFGISNYGITLSTVAREDVRKFFVGALNSAIDLIDKITELQVKKGIYMRPPYIPVIKTVEFAKEQSFLGSFFGDNKPLTCISIAQLFNAAYVNTVGEAYFLGLSQVVKDNKIKDFMDRCRKTVKEHIGIINSFLENDDLFGPRSLTHEVTDSKTNPLSERLSLFCAMTTLTDILNCYSHANISSLRKDIFGKLTTISAQILMLQKDGLDIMLDKGWFEEPPKNVDRKDLVFSH